MVLDEGVMQVVSGKRDRDDEAEVEEELQGVAARWT